MTRLEEIRIELANEYGCKDMVELELLNLQMEHVTDFEKIIAERYAKECVVASINKYKENNIISYEHSNWAKDNIVLV